MEDNKEIYKDEIDEIIRNARQTKIFCADSILEEIDRTEQHQKELKYKLMQIEKAVEEKNIKISSKLKKIEDIITEEKDLNKFYYNLFFYYFVDYDETFGYLLKDNTNFYLKITTYTDNFPLFTDFKEELYVTEEKAKEILNYDEIVEALI